MEAWKHPISKVTRKYKFKIYANAVGRYVRARACVCRSSRVCFSLLPLTCLPAAGLPQLKLRRSPRRTMSRSQVPPVDTARAAVFGLQRTFLSTTCRLTLVHLASPVFLPSHAHVESTQTMPSNAVIAQQFTLVSRYTEGEREEEGGEGQEMR